MVERLHCAPAVAYDHGNLAGCSNVVLRYSMVVIGTAYFTVYSCVVLHQERQTSETTAPIRTYDIATEKVVSYGMAQQCMKCCVIAFS